VAYPPLLKMATEADYRRHYEKKYCVNPIFTFDGISVRFRKQRFGHCFFESSKRNTIKDMFSVIRAERMDWIEQALNDPNADLYVGWDKKRKRYDPQSRVSVVVGNYVVIIRIKSANSAEFVTAYVADPPTLAKIKSGPKWKKQGT
jgi:hypothetical protein